MFCPDHPERKHRPHPPLFVTSGAVQLTLVVGGCGNVCFGHVLVVVRQGQRRDTVAPGEERFGRCTEGQMPGVSAVTTVRWKLLRFCLMGVLS